MSQAATPRKHEGIELPPVGTYKLDTAHTSVEFVARHMLSKVRGRFTEFDGTIVVGEGPEDSTIEVAVQLASVQTNQEQRDGHLKSGDFFEIEKWPVMTFKSTAVRPKGGNRFDLVGDLTIRGVTNEVVLDTELIGWGPDMQGRTVMTFSAGTTIDREDWGITWNMVVETGGFLVGKKVDLDIEVEAILEQ